MKVHGRRPGIDYCMFAIGHARPIEPSLEGDS
jgi:hypothetical protein